MLGFDLVSHTLILAVAGSRALGMHTPQSDVDIKGVLLPPRGVVHGLRPVFPQVDDPTALQVFGPLLRPAEHAAAMATKLEGSVYGVQKLIELAADCNPSALELLFCREEELRLLRPAGALLRTGRDRLLSRRAARTFTGYARAQLARIEGHRAWLLEPPVRPPERADFGLPARPLIPSDQRLAAEAAAQKVLDGWAFPLDGLPAAEVQSQRDARDRFVRESLGGAEVLWSAAAAHAGLPQNLIALLAQERRYATAMRRFAQYQAWVAARNPARAALEAAHGYDTKHAAHLVRLLRMGAELIETGVLHVWRGDRDADELLAVRAGAWSYGRLLEEAQRAEARLADAVRRGEGPLPDAPDPAAVEALCVEVIEAALAEAPWAAPRG